MAFGPVRNIGSIDIAISGMRAESRRMDVVANNIANARTASAGDGKPYRRQEVVLSTDGDALEGVTIGEIMDDTQTPFDRVFMPGHQDADDEGFVQMPNVSLPRELIDLMTASRAYQANAAVLKRYQRSVEATLELLR